MKRFGFILKILLFGLFIIDNSDDNSETIELSESVENEKDSIYNFYENFPKEIIPLQIPYTDYILEARIISLNATIKQNAFIFRNL